MTTTEEQPGQQDALGFSFVGLSKPARAREIGLLRSFASLFWMGAWGAADTIPRARVAGAEAVVMAAFGRPDAYSMVKPEAGTAAGWGTM